LLGKVAGEVVGAVMAAEQRHDGTAIMGDGEHGRLGMLVAERRGKQADEDAGSADADDRPAFGKEPWQQGLGIMPGRAAGEDVATGMGGEGFGERGAGAGEGDDGGGHWLPQASAPR